MVSFPILSIWLCYAYDNVYILLLAGFLQAFLGLTFLDRGMYQFQVGIACITLIAVGLWGLPGIAREIGAMEYVFSVAIIITIDWLSI